MIVQVKNRQALDLGAIARLAVEYAYNKDKMPKDQIAMMMDSIVAWNKKVLITEDEKYKLERIGWFLNKVESGGFEDRRKLFKDKGVDYRKFHSRA